MERLLAEVDGAPGALVYLKATADGKLIVDSGAGSTALTAVQLAAAGLALEATQQQVRDRLPSALANGRLKVVSQDTNGESGVNYITGTGSVTGLAARQVVCLTDTVFSVFTRTNSAGSITGITLPAGTLLTGPVTAITLTSGAVAAYA